MTDLTDIEQENVRAAMRFLAARAGGWKAIAPVLGFSKHTLVHVKKGEKNVSGSMTVRVAKLAGVPVDDVLAGRYPAPGACPHCGRGPEELPNYNLTKMGGLAL